MSICHFGEIDSVLYIVRFDNKCFRGGYPGMVGRFHGEDPQFGDFQSD